MTQSAERKESASLNALHVSMCGCLTWRHERSAVRLFGSVNFLNGLDKCVEVRRMLTNGGCGTSAWPSCPEARELDAVLLRSSGASKQLHYG